MNCRVYINAASKALDREMPHEYRSEWQQHLAEEPCQPQRKDLSVVVLRIGIEWLALSSALLKEILENTVVRRIPHTKDPAILGLVAVRGQIQLCISLGKLLNINLVPSPMSGADEPVRKYKQRLLVIDLQGRTYVFPCDEISGMEYVNSQILSQGGKFSEGLNGRQIEWQKQLLPYLDETLISNALRKRSL